LAEELLALWRARMTADEAVVVSAIRTYNFNMFFKFIQPCSPIRTKEVPAGEGWLHEVKFDGYRVQAHKIGSRVIMYSRNGHDFTERFPSMAQLLHELPAKAAVLDGEVVASDADGCPNFARLHVRWSRPGSIHLWAFDLLAFNAVIFGHILSQSVRRACKRCWSVSRAQPCRYPKPSKTAWRCCAWPRSAASRAW
jgi:ATP-dependent DNA ligase